MHQSNLHTGPLLLCPCCLEYSQIGVGDDSCSCCGNPLPVQYLRGHRELRPLVVQTLGWPGHGKTSFLSALTFLLSRLSLVWPAYTCSPATEATQHKLAEANQHLQTGSLPGYPTKDVQTSYVLLLRGMSRWGGRAFIYQDCAGSHYESMDVPVDKVPFLLKAPTVLMLLSPADLNRADWRTPDMLMNNYLNTLQAHDIDPSSPGRGITVVLTKGDLLQRQLPSKVRGYLRNDPLSAVLKPVGAGGRSLGSEGRFRFDQEPLDDYLQDMREIDRDLRGWLERDPYLKALLCKAEQYGVELRFSVVSATGEQVRADNTLGGPWRPRRVLDPFLWAIQLDDKLGGIPLPPPSTKYSVIVTKRGRPEFKGKANLRSESGRLERLDPELRSVSFRVMEDGVNFQFQWNHPVFIRRGASCTPTSGNSFRLRPGETILFNFWEIELCLGFFRW